jgi:hypothetical protein
VPGGQGTAKMMPYRVVLTADLVTGDRPLLNINLWNENKTGYQAKLKKAFPPPKLD